MPEVRKSLRIRNRRSLKAKEKGIGVFVNAFYFGKKEAE